MALLLSLLIPAAQVSLHVGAKSDLFSRASKTPETGIGVLFNLADALSYTSWATQAKLGFVTFIDLFTTESHPRALFNLYFLAVGWLARLIGTDSSSVMAFSSLLLGPITVFTILRIVRELKFDAPAQALGLVFVLLGSGISGLLFLATTFGAPQLQPGADWDYYDLFPLTSLLFYPYHATTFVLLALIALISTRMFAAAGGPGTTRQAMSIGVLFLITGLVRPYETVALGLVFNLTALFHLIATQGVPLKQRLMAWAIVNLLAFPPVAYAVWISTQPVWGSFASHSVTLYPYGIVYFLKGFGLLWGGAAIGLAFAIADRKRNLAFFACWAIAGAALLMISPNFGSKFAGGSVLPNGILAAYGVRRLLQKSVGVRPLIAAVIGVMALSPIIVFVAVFRVGAPQIDTELLAAGKRIRDVEQARTPVVLTDAKAGAVLAGLFGERVYVGHAALSPDFLEKVNELKRAGIAPPDQSDLGDDRALLHELLRKTKANYVLLQRAAPVAQVIPACSRSKPLFEGERWIAVSTVDWACS